MDHHDVGLAADGGDRRDVADEIEIEFVVERALIACAAPTSRSV